MMEHHDLAKQHMEKALDIDPENPAYLYFDGMLHSVSLYASLSMEYIWWRYKLVKVSGATDDPLEGTWKVAPEVGCLGVGPVKGDKSWWTVDETILSDRYCFFDDAFVFGPDGSFRNELGTETWIEDWQGGSNICGTPVAPHDGTAAATYTYNQSTGKLTLYGKGAYLGIPKAYNGGELTSPDYAPNSITYLIEFSENNTVMTVDINAGGGEVRKILGDIEDTYLKLYELDPDFHNAKLSLVELYALVSPETGGRAAIAEKYATELEAEDLVSGAIAREILMSPDADYIAYWSELNDRNAQNADLVEALGRSYLWANDPEKAWTNFQKAMELDKNRNYLYLEMGRYYMMMAMQGQLPIGEALPVIMEEFENYLGSKPEPNKPMQAWTIGQMAMLNLRTENEEEGNKLIEEAKALDPYYSKASGTPSSLLFIPPDSVSQTFNYLSRPF
jgi:hypothetical protein